MNAVVVGPVKGHRKPYHAIVQDGDGKEIDILGYAGTPGEAADKVDQYNQEKRKK